MGKVIDFKKQSVSTIKEFDFSGKQRLFKYDEYYIFIGYDEILGQWYSKIFYPHRYYYSDESSEETNRDDDNIQLSVLYDSIKYLNSKKFINTNEFTEIEKSTNEEYEWKFSVPKQVGTRKIRKT